MCKFSCSRMVRVVQESVWFEAGPECWPDYREGGPMHKLRTEYSPVLPELRRLCLNCACSLSPDSVPDSVFCVERSVKSFLQ